MSSVVVRPAIPTPFTEVVAGRLRVLCCHRARLNRESPPNSLSGVRECIAAAAPRIEIDVRFTSDDVPVVFHDATLDHDTDGAGAIFEHDAAALGRFKLRDRDEGIPRLEEVLDLLRGTSTRLQVDLKPLAPLTSNQVSALRGVLEPFGEQVLLGSQAYWSLRAFEGSAVPLAFDPTLLFGSLPWIGEHAGLHPHDVGPEGLRDDHPLARLPGRDVRAYIECRLDDFCRTLAGVRELMVNTDTILLASRLGVSMGDYLARNGVELSAWTLSDGGAADTVALMTRLFEAGVTTLITDDPLALSGYLAPISSR